MGAGASVGIGEQLAAVLGSAAATEALEDALSSTTVVERAKDELVAAEPDFTLTLDAASDRNMQELAAAYSAKTISGSAQPFVCAVNAGQDVAAAISAALRCSELTANSPMKLDMSSGTFNDDVMVDVTNINVISLNIGATAIKSIALMSLRINSQSLLSLDLSYSESLELVAGSFLLLVNLRRLNLDGCNIADTSSDISIVQRSDSPDPPVSKSIFLGLVRLTDLSLNENNLSDVQSLTGLVAFFSMPYCRLQRLSITDNEDLPYSAYSSYVAAAVKTLLFVDNMCTANHIVSAFPVVPGSRGAAETVGHAGFLDEKGLDSMEREFLMALKNEKDVTVVS